MSKSSRQINLIVHIPEDDETKNKLQEAINSFYIQCIESRLRESTLTLKQKKELLDFLIEKHKVSQE